MSQLPAGASQCGGAVGPAPAASTGPSTDPEPGPPQPKVEIVDFVCEADVRTALAKRAKIFVGPKTIVTPAARDLAAATETIVVAER